MSKIKVQTTFDVGYLDKKTDKKFYLILAYEQTKHGNISVLEQHGYDLFNRIFDKPAADNIISAIYNKHTPKPEIEFTKSGIFTTKEGIKSAKVAAKSINKKSRMPVLSMVCITAKNGRLFFMGTNLEKMTITSCEYVGDDFSVCLPPTTFIDWLKLADTKDTTIGVNTEYDYAELQSGNSLCLIKGISAQEFPMNPDNLSDGVYIRGENNNWMRE